MEMNRITVALDGSKSDKAIISYVMYLHKFLQFKHIEFLHVELDKPLPYTITNDTIEFHEESDMIGFATQPKRPQIHQFSKIPNNITVTEVFLKGHPLDAILKYIKEFERDLIVVGIKKESTGSGVLPYKVARKANCSVLLVPDEGINEIQSIFTPFDFSSHSKLALEFNKKMMEQNQNITLDLYNVYSVPKVYNDVQMTYQEFTEMIKKDKSEAIDKIVIKSFTNIMNVSVEVEANNLGIVDHLEKKIKRLKPDLIVLGSKGKTNAHAAFLGSIAESITENHADIPLFILKKKGENIDLLNAIFN